MPSIHDMNCSNRRGDLKNLTKKEFATLFLQYTDQMLDMKDQEEREFELPDGRVLRFWHTTFPPSKYHPEELREWAVHLYTLDQKTPRCLRKFKQRDAWAYLTPYCGEGYKTDPTGKWSYSVWR